MPETDTPKVDRPYLMDLRNVTALSRLNHTEAEHIFDALESLGYTVVRKES